MSCSENAPLDGIALLLFIKGWLHLSNNGDSKNNSVTLQAVVK